MSENVVTTIATPSPKKARVVSARVSKIELVAMGSTVTLPVLEHGRAGNKGAETAILFGPRKLTNRAHVEGFAQCMEEMHPGGMFDWGRLYEGVRNVAFPHAINLPEDLYKAYGAEKISVRKPSRTEMGGGLLSPSLWVVDFKATRGGKDEVIGQAFSLFGTFFASFESVAKFLVDWEAQGHVDLSVVETWLWEVRVPPNLASIGSIRDANDDLDDLVLLETKEPTGRQKMTKFIMRLFSPAGPRRG